MNTRVDAETRSSIGGASGGAGASSSEARNHQAEPEDEPEARTERNPRSQSAPKLQTQRPKRTTPPGGIARERHGHSSRHDDDELGFLAHRGTRRSREFEEVAQDFAEQFLTGVTSGQEAHGDAQDRIWEMELGGPFVITSDKRELARSRRGQDDFESEAFPTPSGPASVPAPDDFDEEEEEED